MDPRIIESGVLFASMVGGWLPRLGVEDSEGHYQSLLLAEIAR